MHSLVENFKALHEITFQLIKLIKIDISTSNISYFQDQTNKLNVKKRTK